MSRKRIVLLGLAQAMGVFLYVILVVLFINNLDRIAGLPPENEQTNSSMQAVGILLLFIISACVSGALVLGYPAILALRQRIREASLLVASTVAWLVLLLVMIVIAIGLGIVPAD
ncbi:MAG: hypothetical protein HW388_760 [Dehalococcoidia bacterium]|nr:hypothetical protein [Dehalococcoidia bacterium]